jgi:hypothetical protein
MVPEFPNKPQKEISRDSTIRWIASEFGPCCQKQVITAGPLTGKTNFIAQFAQYYPNQVISYFINSNPLTQDLKTFLYVICSQLCQILEKPNLPENITTDELKSTFTSLAFNLSNQAKKNNKIYYFAIDGLEWGIAGDKGHRIIDYPLTTFSGSPYLLYSCKTDAKDNLPIDNFQIIDKVSHQLEFNQSDTQEYLSDLKLEIDEIKKIHQKSQGLPGYIKIIRDTIQTSGSEWIKSNELPNNLENLIKKQLKFIKDNSEENINKALGFIAVSPKPLNLPFLANIIKTDKKYLLETLLKTSIVFYDETANALQISPEFTREVLKSQLAPIKEALINELLQQSIEATDKDELFITLLMREAKDYEGISEKLNNENVIETFTKTHNINLISKRFNIASQMAYENKDILGLMNWSLRLQATKLLISHVLNSQEISALIAIGEAQNALRRAYALPESTIKIRLLARAYTAMQEANERIPKGALEELELLVTTQNLQDLDREALQELATDIFPILPALAVSLIEDKFSRDEEINTLEAAIDASGSKPGNQIDAKRSELINPEIGQILNSYSKWLGEIPLIKLIQNIEELKSTKAKEFMIQQWCSQNKESLELDQGIQLWIDTVVEDSSFSIPLRSLRKVSNSLKYVKDEYQEKLVYRLEIPTFSSIRTPWEEWIGFHLNIAEILHTHNEKQSKERIDAIYETINLEIEDQDIKVFCYARLWSTASKYYKELEQTVKLNLERVISSLLCNAALHDEILNKTLQTIAGIDVQYSIEKALEMNTRKRRNDAIKLVIITSLRKNPNLDISETIEKIIHHFDENEQSMLFLNIAQQVSQKNKILSEKNQATLLKYCKKIPDPSMRADALSHLVMVWDNEKIIRSEKIIKDLVSLWSQEDDLIFRISLGYKIVERIADKHRDAAKNLYQSIQDINLLPGGTLAAGDLRHLFLQTVDAAIHSLNLRTLSNKEGFLGKIYKLIDNIPSSRIRIMLYGQIAAQSFTEGYSKEAEEVIRNKILPSINKITNLYDKNISIKFCFPVIFKDSKQTAYELVKNLPESLKDLCWAHTVNWLLVMGSLQNDINFEHLKVGCDYLKIKDSVIEAAKNINRDELLYLTIAEISKVIEHSARTLKIDAIQAQTLLQILEELAEKKLPDKQNINHNGYLIVSKAVINGARSTVYKTIAKKGNLSKIDIRKKWSEIEAAAKTIPNTADKVYVMGVVAKELHKHHSQSSEDLLNETDTLLDGIPTLIDRTDRMEEIAKIWSSFGKNESAQYTLTKAVKLIEQMSDVSYNKRLEALVQAAYELNPEFSDHLISKYDSRFPNEVFNPLRISNETQKLKNNPEKINKLYGEKENPFLRFIIGASAEQQYIDLISGHGKIPDENVLLEWVKYSNYYEENSFHMVIKWVQECLKNKYTSYELTSIFVDLAALILILINKVSPERHEGIPEEIMNILPGLSSKVAIFRTGEYEKAKIWLTDWLKKYSEEYIKVVDPYFGPEQLIFFADIPKNCKMLIVSTDYYFKDYGAPEKIKSELEHIWKQIGKGACPLINLILVPTSQEDQFHDRVIISKNRGLDLGQSLNGLGNKTGKITDLAYEDSKELESKYVDDMLNHNTWFINHDIQAMIIRIGNPT